jgi:hypothetical protein
LILNPQKTNIIPFRTKQNRETPNFNIYIDNNEIDKGENTQFLGLHLDAHLSWDLHVDNILSKINSSSHALKSLFCQCSIEIFRTVYAHVQFHIYYGICVYGGTTSQNLNKILIGQKRAL